MSHSVAKLMATWFGCGYAPVAPGTAGSLAAVIPAWFLAEWAGWPPYAFGLLALAITVPGVLSADIVARDSGKTDPGLVVIDEVAGQWLTLAGAASLNWKTILAGFLLFRVFDIWKPPPARQLERLHGGIGIMADDLMAGVYGAITLWLAGMWMPGSLQ